MDSDELSRFVSVLSGYSGYTSTNAVMGDPGPLFFLEPLRSRGERLIQNQQQTLR